MEGSLGGLRLSAEDTGKVAKIYNRIIAQEAGKLYIIKVNTVNTSESDPLNLIFEGNFIKTEGVILFTSFIQLYSVIRSPRVFIEFIRPRDIKEA